MLRIITGRAGAGKTARIMDELRERVEAGRAGGVLLVPEQYSHEAERELAHIAGPRAALYAEVLSFTGVARRVEAELGPGGKKPLTAGGRLLCMSLALEAVYSRLRVYGRARRSPELQLELLAAVDELAASEHGSEELEAAAGALPGALGNKLRDLALIRESFEAAVGSGRTDPSDRLSLLAARLPYSGFARDGEVYIDGFTDFTAQEKRVICELMDRADVTLCLTLDSVDYGSELFDLARATARYFLRHAREEGIASRVEPMEAAERSPMDTLAENLLAYPARSFDAEGRIRLLAARDMTAECEFAAAEALRLARAGCRWRDISVAARGFEDYRAALEAAFERFGVPLFTATRPNAAEKPLPSLISAAYGAAAGGWEAAEVFAFLRTGLAGLDSEECDELENYCFTWNIGYRRWHEAADWGMHPDGWRSDFDDAVRERLARINGLRRRAAAPLLKFEEALRSASLAGEHCAALAGLWEDLDLAERLAERAAALERSGRRQAAAEYERIWDAAVDALEQCSAVLGDLPMDAETFSRLYLLTLSQYSLGVIPVSLDMVTAGDLDRMRRRHIKHLIILGADDARLPAPEGEGGVFTPDERRTLAAAGLELDAGEAELWREYTLIYNCVTLPSESLTLVMPSRGADGSAREPSFLINRARGLFNLELRPARRAEDLLESENTALEATCAAQGGSAAEGGRAALEYFRRADSARLRRAEAAAKLTRGRLSRESAARLYGENLRLSASRMERFASCRFSYFMTYGLKARPRVPARFKAPEAGTFIHYVLQHVAAGAGEGGIAALPDERLAALTREFAEEYLAGELGGREGKSARFIYLFERLARSLERIVLDMAGELRDSDFKPLDFELNLAEAGAVRALALPEGGSVRASGIADRVDGWVRGGRLYLRVVDYKTGKKSFSLSDVYYGLGMQMLLYLFALAETGRERYGMETLPAGVLYVPARDEIISADSDMSDEAVAAERAKALVRSGLLLDDAGVLHAMERGERPLRLPLSWKDGAPSGQALASAEQLGALAKHVRETLRAMAREIRSGSIQADPCYKSERDNACLYCDYASACRFAPGEGGDRRRPLRSLKAERVWELLLNGETAPREGENEEGGGENA